MKTLTFKANGHLLGAGDGTQVNVSASLSEPYVFGLALRCGACDERPAFKVNGNVVTVREPCPYPDGMTSVITLAVPSGRIVVTDDLRPVYDWDDRGMASYNSALGQHQAIEAMARAGCAYGPVGNSSPGLYRTGASNYVIAGLAYDEESGTEVLPEGWEALAGIITDLWAYSIADYEDWVSRGGDPESLGWGDTVVDLPPGTYEFTHHTGERGFNRYAAGTVVFAGVRRLEGPS